MPVGPGAGQRRPGGPGGPGGRPGGPGGRPGGRGPGGPGGPGDGPGGRRGKRDGKPKKEGWRRFVPSWKMTALIVAVMMLAFATLVGVAYAMTPMPSETQAHATKEESVISFRNGEALARFGVHRESIAYKDIPEVARNAVLAAEDRNFWTEPGISPTGVARAVFNAGTGGEVTGASTITQQLARNYFKGLSQERTISRKFKEIFISIRVGNEMKKEEVLNLYLNTVAFGRGAYGIQAASRAYFHKPVKQLKVNEAAMLAALIQRPEYFHTLGDDNQPEKKALINRWNYVLDGMVEKKWLSPEERAKQVFPKTQKEWSDVDEDGQTGYLKQRVLNELKTLGITQAQLDLGGLRIKTTFDKKLQDYTASVIQQMRKEKNLNKEIRFGLSTVDPKTGGVVAAYGGPSFAKQQFDDSFQGKIQPGSSFKPIVLATALSQGVSLKTTMDGSYKRTIAGGTFTNDARSENGVYNLTQMTAMSINTAYVELGQKVGLDKVAEMAKKMGIPKNTPSLNDGVTSLPLGVIDVTPVTMASVYSTFANEGKHTPVHVISEITDKDGKPVTNSAGKVIKKNPYKAEEVFSKDVAADATHAMQAVVRSGTGKLASLGTRPVAGKTGTTDANKAAWFVGYTPQLSTSVAMWRQGADNSLKSLQGIGGYNQIYGGTVPAEIFKRFMTKALDGREIEQFPPPANGGTVAPWAAAKPSPSPSTSASPSTPTTCEPTQPGQAPPTPRPGEPCPETSPSPTPSTTTSPPPTGGDKPCNQVGMPVGCNPNIPPSNPAPKWWCASHPSHEACQRDPDEGEQPR
ncbi:transglycosylase domain-containing protein [Spirillospora sp. CA-294931]|uniref:transglycosylase domain-containing protein n=1 Tax=Spirillospora sp. CA-294931 TaxID=3240042 RepID=UPI003D92809C